MFFIRGDSAHQGAARDAQGYRGKSFEGGCLFLLSFHFIISYIYIFIGKFYIFFTKTGRWIRLGV